MFFIIPGKHRNVGAIIRNSIYSKDYGQTWEDVVHQRQSNWKIVRMGRIVRQEWVMSKWKGTALKKERERFEAIRFLKQYFTPIRCWEPGTLYQALLAMQPRWTPGSILSALSNQKATRASRRFRRTPDRGLADLFVYWTQDLLHSN